MLSSQCRGRRRKNRTARDPAQSIFEDGLPVESMLPTFDAFEGGGDMDMIGGIGDVFGGGGGYGGESSEDWE